MFLRALNISGMSEVSTVTVSSTPSSIHPRNPISGILLPIPCVVYLFVLGIEVLSKQLVHSKHMNFILLEDSTHSIIAANNAFVIGIL